MHRVQKTKENLENCLCPQCPTYNECTASKSENLFCSGDVGKTSCDLEKNGCICGGCRVHTENGLKGFYYCREGAAEIVENKL